MLKLFLFREKQYEDKAFIGNLYIAESDGTVVFRAPTLERAWLNNERNVSCIPRGTYPLRFLPSLKFKTDLWELQKVPNRSECKFHVANRWDELNGCIALGSEFKDYTNDGVPEVLNSKITLESFHRVLKNLECETLYLSVYQ